MKSFIFILSLFLSAHLYSQVGIKTATPQATLHSVGNLQITKELSVGGTGTTYGNVGNIDDILISGGPGVAPQWKKVEDIEVIPLIAGIGIKTDALTPNPLGGASYAAGISTKVKFSTIPKIKAAFLSYNATTGEYTVNKAGYYKLIGYLSYNLEDNYISDSDTNTEGTALTILKKNNAAVIVATSTYHHEVSEFVAHTVSGSAYFAVGDKITLHGSHTQKYKFGKSTLSILYTGN